MFTSFLPQVIGAILALITFRMYSELLTPIQLGEAMLALGGIALFDAIFSSSVNQVVFYYGSNKNFKYKVFSFLKNYKRFTTVIGLMIILLIIIVSFLDLYNFYGMLVLILLGYAVIEPSRSSLFSLLNLSGTRKIYGLQVILDAIFNFTLIFLALYFKPNWVFLLVGILTSRYFSLVTNSLFLRSSFDLSENLNEKNIVLDKKEVLKQIQPVMLMGIIGWLSGFADRYIIAGSIGVSGAGYYSLATGLVGRPYNVTTSALTVHFRPDLYKFNSENEYGKFQDIAKNWLKYALIIGVVGIVLFAILGGPLVDVLLAKEYRTEIENILYVIAGAYCFTIMTHAIDNKFLAKGLGVNLFKLQLILTPFPFVFIVIGALYNGVEGAVIGKLIAEIFKFLIMFYASKKIDK